MNIILIVLACIVVRIIYKTTMATLEQQPDEAHIVEAQREHANEYRAFERRERERAMRR
jgi:hypothetical protein